MCSSTLSIGTMYVDRALLFFDDFFLLRAGLPRLPAKILREKNEICQYSEVLESKKEKKNIFFALPLPLIPLFLGLTRTV